MTSRFGYDWQVRILREQLLAYSPLLTQRRGHVSEYPVVASGQVSVHRIGILWTSGIPPEQILAEHFPHLSIAEVFAALSCFCANETLFRAVLNSEDTETERLATELALAAAPSA